MAVWTRPEQELYQQKGEIPLNKELRLMATGRGRISLPQGWVQWRVVSLQPSDHTHTSNKNGLSRLYLYTWASIHTYMYVWSKNNQRKRGCPLENGGEHGGVGGRRVPWRRKDTKEASVNTLIAVGAHRASSNQPLQGLLTAPDKFKGSFLTPLSIAMQAKSGWEYKRDTHWFLGRAPRC